MDPALELLPADYWRWWLTANAPETADTDFTWEQLRRRVNKDLADVLGNFVNRCLTFAAARFDGVVPEAGQTRSPRASACPLARRAPGALAPPSRRPGTAQGRRRSPRDLAAGECLSRGSRTVVRDQGRPRASGDHRQHGHQPRPRLGPRRLAFHSVECRESRCAAWARPQAPCLGRRTTRFRQFRPAGASPSRLCCSPRSPSTTWLVSHLSIRMVRASPAACRFAGRPCRRLRNASRRR